MDEKSVPDPEPFLDKTGNFKHCNVWNFHRDFDEGWWKECVVGCWFGNADFDNLWIIQNSKIPNSAVLKLEF